MDNQTNQPSWYALHTQPRRELMVASILDEKEGITTFYPEVLQPKAEGKRLAPLFPGYLFVQADLASGVGSQLRYTPCVINLVGNQQHPLPIADHVVEALQARTSAINEQGGLAAHSFRQGDAVVFKSGPLQGMDAIFVGPMEPQQRVHVLLEFLGQEQQMEVDVNLLEKTNALPAQQKARRPRRSRGRGRRIAHRN